MRCRAKRIEGNEGFMNTTFINLGCNELPSSTHQYVKSSINADVLVHSRVRKSASTGHTHTHTHTHTHKKVRGGEGCSH